MKEILFEDAFNLKQGNHLAINDLHADGFDVFGANGIVGKFDKYMYEEPTVLVTCRGATCGSINLTTPKSWVTGNAIALVPKIKVDTKYIFYQLKGTGFKDVISGSAQPQIIVSTLSRKKFKLLPFEEQQKIASILEQTDAARQKRKQANQLTEQFLQSAFLEMFGDPVGNEKGWEKKRLENIAETQIGPFGTQLHEEDYIENGIPLINPRHIVNGKIKIDFKQSITKEKFKTLSNYHLITGDVIMGRRGEMGRCALITERENGWLCGTGSLFMRPNKSLNSTYLIFVLSHPAFVRELENSAQGVTMMNLNLTIINNLNIPLPTLPLQQKFASLVEQVEQLQVKQRESEKELENLFGSLMQRYFGN